ncbi:Gfo/Idh/MocA family protein [Tessaracoccus massiliensis]|uniref:Gfo/Idh/MocA family protein n=1 Tax=Tessaracoccus massiliensis TaxID=1522311 RepID=UPI00058E0E6E|nr:Gfo/Idh/MocA family oxidoreductase [Tessaracoccus massiliensis]
MLRVGIIGAGIMGRDHARLLATQVAGAKVAAIADISVDGARAVADQYGAEGVFSTGEELIASGLVDAVIIASPDPLHAATTLAAIEAGLPTLCEKPLAPTVAEATPVAEAHAALERPLVSVGFMRRFDPGYVAMRRRLDEGRDGKLLMSHSVHRNVSTQDVDSAVTITNSAVHELDIVAWLTRSPIVEVQWAAGRTTSLLQQRIDPQLILLRTADEVLHTVSLQMQAQYGYDVRCELVCERASVELPHPPSLNDEAPLIVSADLGRTAEYAADWRPRFEAAYRRELKAWVEASLAGEVPAEAATVEEAMHTTRVSDALVRSMNDGGWVPVSE